MISLKDELTLHSVISIDILHRLLLGPSAVQRNVTAQVQNSKCILPPCFYLSKIHRDG